uniref:CCHC-type domain-containing protein n=1 Tax=Fagus sylvatica TaxID=28930 RepID=A0A2N9J841_FAGSY
MDEDFVFTIVLHYWGKIKTNPFTYEGGQVNRVENIKSDEMSFIEILNIGKEFGYDETDIWMYRVPTVPFAGGLRYLDTDIEVLNMVKFAKVYNEVEMVVMRRAASEEAAKASSEEDSAHRVHFGDSESDVNDMFEEYISSDVVASEVSKEVVEDHVRLSNCKQYKRNACKRVKIKVGRKGYSGGIDAVRVGSDLVARSGVGAENDAAETSWESETSAVVSSSSDDESRPRYPQYQEPKAFTELKFELGMQFATKQDVTDAVRHYSVFKGVQLRFKKNDKIRVRVKCVYGCPFELFFGKMANEDTWQLKLMKDEHNCGTQLKNKHASYKWLGKHLVEDVKNDPKTYRAKRVAKQLIDGSCKEQYAQLGDYSEELIRSNPGSNSIIHTERPQPHLQPRFGRFYVCLDACKRGFLAGCRPFIGLDGCHLKGQYTGQLLTAIGKDANNGVYPIAYAVAEAELKESWEWFLEMLFKDIGDLSYESWTFMSDQQKGLVPTFEKLMPVDHRFCVRHLYNNFSKEFKGKLLKDRMWAAARATNMAEFEIEMEKIKDINVKAWKWLDGHPKEHWDKPIITMMEEIRLLLMDRYVKMKSMIGRYKGRICPRIHKKLEIEKSNSRTWTPRWSGDDDLSVYEVSMYPRSAGKNIEDFVHSCYNMTSFALAYEPCVLPINGPDLWPQSNRDTILPPPYRKQPGRPKKRRRREHDEPRNTYRVPRIHAPGKCRKCGQVGHNKRSCKNDPTNETAPPSQTAAGPSSLRRKIMFRRRQPSHTIETATPSDDIVQSQPAPTSQTEPPSDIVVQSQPVPTIQTEPPSDIVVQSQPAPTIQTSAPSRNKSMVRPTEALRRCPIFKASNRVSMETMATASEASKRITRLFMDKKN